MNILHSNFQTSSSTGRWIFRSFSSFLDQFLTLITNIEVRNRINPILTGLGIDCGFSIFAKVWKLECKILYIKSYKRLQSLWFIVGHPVIHMCNRQYSNIICVIRFQALNTLIRIPMFGGLRTSYQPLTNLPPWLHSTQIIQ